VNSSVLWILFPGFIALFCLFLQRRETLVALLGAFVALSLAGLAYWLPSAEQFVIGPWIVQFDDTWVVLGRRFVLTVSDRPTIIVLYLATGLWLGAVPLARPGPLFVPLSLGMVALLTAAIAVEPFLYAALLIEIAVLLSIPFLIASGTHARRGAIRYLTFQTLGVPFILLAGRMLTGVEVTPGDEDLLLRATAFLGLGFAFLLAVFPFHTWIPMLGGESHPYAAAFVFLLLPGAVSLLGLSFLERFSWLGNVASTYVFIEVVGIGMVFTAGVWAAFQRDLGRLMGYAFLIDIGFSLLTLSLAQGQQIDRFLGLYFASLVPRGLAMGVWALALSHLRRKAGGLDFGQVLGMGRESPLLMASIVLANLSIAGLPTLASFPPRIAIYQQLSGASPALSIYLAMIGSLGLIIGGLRTLGVLAHGPEEARWKFTEPPILMVYLVAGLVALLALGLAPQLFLPAFTDMPLIFRQPLP
jgi:formate hydrogenlyase subunit 3/multisubunit Na+/H+ antiporter MnhD subunit